MVSSGVGVIVGAMLAIVGVTVVPAANAAASITVAVGVGEAIGLASTTIGAMTSAVTAFVAVTMLVDVVEMPTL